ncbi:MAG: oligoendopeptidase F, partial [Candidatus Afipia apatlaquensis]|nr:oligoendopeptidase F [Candidatus Afipia apatlaquensis]
MTESNAVAKRQEIHEKYRWRLEDIYSDDTLWEKDFTLIKEMLPEVAKFRGSIGKSGEALLSCLELKDKV